MCGRLMIQSRTADQVRDRRRDECAIPRVRNYRLGGNGALSQDLLVMRRNPRAENGSRRAKHDRIVEMAFNNL
jgi:hypothetical protein